MGTLGDWGSSYRDFLTQSSIHSHRTHAQLLVCDVVLNFPFSSAIILVRNRELFALPHVTVDVLCPVLAVPWVGVWYVIVAFPGHTHSLFYIVHVCLILW